MYELFHKLLEKDFWLAKMQILAFFVVLWVFPRFFWANSFSKFSADIMKFLLQQIFLFISDLLFQKIYPLLKFKAMPTELHQRPIFDIFYQALFCSFTSSKNFVLNVFPSAEGQFLWRGFTLLDKNRSFLEFPSIFRKIKSKRKVFRQSWTKHFQAFSHFDKISVQNKWMWVCVCMSYLTSCRTT